MFIKHKKPIDPTPSRFVVESVQKICIPPKSLVLDMPVGYGRNSLFLLSKGFNVCGADYDFLILRDGWHKSLKNIFLVQLDATKKLPFADDLFELVVTVHFVTKDIMSIITRCIKPGGYLIFETYSGVGENWMTLPQVGEIQKDLKNSFEILGCQERIVGPRKENVSAKILGKKLNG